MKRHEITEKQWNRIKDYLPPEKKPHGGRPGKSNRFIFHAILYWLNTGIPWRDLPEWFGPWQTVHGDFVHGRVLEYGIEFCPPSSLKIWSMKRR